MIEPSIELKNNMSRAKFTAESHSYHLPEEIDAVYRPNKLPVLLVHNVRDESGKIVKDRYWFDHHRAIHLLGELIVGELIAFEAAIDETGMIHNICNIKKIRG
jgi:hypothetical protein